MQDLCFKILTKIYFKIGLSLGCIHYPDMKSPKQSCLAGNSEVVFFFVLFFYLFLAIKSNWLEIKTDGICAINIR